jgi:magnesium chelatase family protein
MIGPPGSGKSMLARRLPSILPQLEPALREPLETGETVIARANHRISYPSRIQLIAAMNPCRCGRAGEPGYVCRKGRACAERYQARISGPMLDRIDLQIEVPAVSAADLVLPQASEGSAEVRARVSAARRIQPARYAAFGCQRIRTNSECDGTLLDEIAAPDASGLALLRDAADALSLSARGSHRTLRVARTLADLDGEDRVARIHVAEALSYRGETLRRAQVAA